jgi:5'-3' exonuclease
MKRTLLIDGDVIAYQQSVIAEQAIQWDETLWTLHADANQVISNTENLISAYKELLSADEVMIILTDSNNWRKDILPSYKENRKGQRKPVTLGAAREHLIYNWNAKVFPTLEADDVIGIYATDKLRLAKNDYVVVGVDKDFKTIVGKHYNPNKSELGITEVTPLEADRYWMTQALMGDQADGYKGCLGIGEKKATALLAEATTLEEMWEIVETTFMKQGQMPLDALTNARVARILRHGDYNFKTHKVNLWTPKTK